MDTSTIFGLVLAIGGIVAGLLIEGGSVSQVLQPTAAMIVFGGTLGAVMVQYPMALVLRSFGQLKTVFAYKEQDVHALIAQLLAFAAKARKEGIVSLDKDLETVDDPFLKKTLMLAIDGSQPEELRHNMETELSYRTEAAERLASVYESAGGFAPTIGIIGAILGLIQVMQHLDHINEVGRGIAVAFVATIYGVASANLFFLPIAGKLKVRQREEDLRCELTLEGVVAILSGMNPRLLQSRLKGLVADQPERTAAEPAAPKAAPIEAEAPAAGAT
jgi:chemotaxis protein MotA